MSNNQKIERYSIFIAFALVALTIGSVLYLITKNNAPAATVTENKAIQVNEKLYDEVTNPGKYGQEITLEEEGFGRENPFAPYK